MFGPVILLLCLCTAFAHGATIPNLDEILNQLKLNDIDFTELRRIFDRENEVDSNADICETETCKRESATVLDYMDQKVDPCENFYDFACGKYLHERVLTNDQIAESAFSKIQDKVKKQLEAALTEDIQSDELHAFILAKQFNKMCLDEKGRNQTGVNPLLEILEKIGGWPVVKGDKWDADHWDWLQAHREMNEFGMNSDVIVEFSIKPHFQNSSKRVIHIDRPDFGLPDEYLLAGLKHPHTATYLMYMIISATILGAKPANAKDELHDALLFEMELVKISLRLNERTATAISNEFNVKTLQTTFPYIDWREYISWNLQNAVKIDDDEIIFVPDVNYLHQLHKLIEKTAKRTVANYFGWRSVMFSSSLLSDTLFLRNQQYEAAILGKIKPNAWRMECVQKTIKYFPITVAAAYIRKYFDKKSRFLVESLTHDVHHQFIEKLEKIPWMDEKTRKEAIRKANAMAFRIGYPDELTDDDKMNGYYSGLELSKDSLFHSVLKIRKFGNLREIKALHEPIVKNDWREEAKRVAIVNAFNMPQLNTIQIPAAILQDQFFSAKRPSYMTYGTVGWVIGHEITHGFDNHGRQLDFEGNLKNWWQKDTLEEFNSRAQCFIDKYSSYKHPTLNLTVNGKITLGENIADVGGVKAAHAAYQRFVKSHGPESVLPGMNFTPDQLFWITGAQIWCSTMKKEYESAPFYDVHAPDRYRVLGTLSSSTEFAKDFKCAPNTPMNPIKKCEIW